MSKRHQQTNHDLLLEIVRKMNTNEQKMEKSEWCNEHVIFSFNIHIFIWIYIYIYIHLCKFRNLLPFDI
jgi:hypothetical protein